MYCRPVHTHANFFVNFNNVLRYSASQDCFTSLEVCYIHFAPEKILHSTSSFIPLCNIPLCKFSSLLALDSGNNLPRVLARPKLHVVNALPRASVQPAIRNGHRNTRTHQTALDVRGHVVQALRRMPVKVALAVLRRKAVERIAHVLADLLVPVLVHGERAGGVLHEQVQDADFVVFELGQLARDFVRDQVAAAGFGGEGELFLEERHGGRLWEVGGFAGGWRAAGAGW